MNVLVNIPPNVLEAIDGQRTDEVRKATQRVELKRQREKLVKKLRNLPVDALKRIHDEARKGHVFAEKATAREREAHRKAVYAELTEVERQLTLIGERHVSRVATINALLVEALRARGVAIPEE